MGIRVIVGSLSETSTFVVGMGAVVLVLVWGAITVSRFVRRSAERGVVVFQPSTTPLAMFGTLLGAILIASGVNNLNGETVIGFGFLSLFCLIVLATQLPALMVVSADDNGLTISFLGRRKSMAWKDVDWVYGLQSSMSTRGRARRTRSFFDTRVILEAGPRRRITIPLAMGGDATSRDALFKMAFERTTNARQGFRKARQVAERRAAK